jgi:hypothetical protein
VLLLFAIWEDATAIGVKVCLSDSEEGLCSRKRGRQMAITYFCPL